MIDKNTHFPQYRKLSNEKTYYKILDSCTFEELMFIGSKKVKFTIIATKYPEMLRIKDMLELVEPFYLSTEEEFNRLTNQST